MAAEGSEPKTLYIVPRSFVRRRPIAERWLWEVIVMIPYTFYGASKELDTGDLFIFVHLYGNAAEKRICPLLIREKLLPQG